MKLAAKFFIAFMAISLGLSLNTPLATTEAAPAANHISPESFTGIYYLNRDSRGLSLLTTEETIVADFPGGGFYGITRALPKKFQNRPVDIKILNVSDAAGNPVPYKTGTDNNDNLIVTTGDPSITLYGSQTIKLKYQTRGVVNLNQKADEFLLDVNGRGWNQPFSRVNATLYIPDSFGADLKDNPACYTALGSSNSNDCRISVQKTSQTTVISSRAGPLAAHQALVLRLDFAPSTFTNNHAHLSTPLLAASATAIFVVAITTVYIRRKR